MEEEGLSEQQNKKEEGTQGNGNETEGDSEESSVPPHALAGYFNDEQEALAVRCLSQGFLEQLNEPLIRLAKQLHELEYVTFIHKFVNLRLKAHLRN